MTRKTILDKEEFERRFQERLKALKTHNPYMYDFVEKPRKEWDDEDKRNYRNTRSLLYCEMRRELLDKRNKLWAMDITRIGINEVLNSLGLKMCNDGRVRCINSGAPILKWFIEKIVLPQLKDKCGITGVKMRRNATPNCYNLLDFTQADMDINLIKTEKNIEE